VLASGIESAGSRSDVWSGADNSGQSVSNGIYVVVLHTENTTAGIKVQLLN